jgi:hypothetical protein
MLPAANRSAVIVHTASELIVYRNMVVSPTAQVITKINTDHQRKRRCTSTGKAVMKAVAIVVKAHA